MSINYTIECRHCGIHTSFEYHTTRRITEDRNLDEQMYIDTECAIRCPHCRARLNGSVEEFRSQITIKCGA